jgi:hypothetical protein
MFVSSLNSLHFLVPSLAFSHHLKKDSFSQCYGSGMFIPDPDFYPFRIPDPKTATKERGEKKLLVKPFFVATNFTKLKIILFFKYWRKKFGPVFKEL